MRLRNAETAKGSSFRIQGVAQEDSRMEPQTVWVRDSARRRQCRQAHRRGGHRSAGLVRDRPVHISGDDGEQRRPWLGRTTYLLKVGDGVNAAEKTLALNLQLGERGLRAAEIGDEVRRIQSLRMLLNELLQGSSASACWPGSPGWA